jgi:hypothetical protein
MALSFALQRLCAMIKSDLIVGLGYVIASHLTSWLS